MCLQSPGIMINALITGAKFGRDGAVRMREETNEKDREKVRVG